MGDVGDIFRAHKKRFKDLKADHGVRCPECKKNLPKAQPKILLPNQRCWCGYRDPRERLSDSLVYGEAPVNQEVEK